jgi:hypothetical protein
MKIITRYSAHTLAKKVSFYVSITAISLITLISTMGQASAAQHDNDSSNKTSNTQSTQALKIQSFSQLNSLNSSSDRKSYWLNNKTTLLNKQKTLNKKSKAPVTIGTSRENHRIAIENNNKKRLLNNQQSLLNHSRSKGASVSAYQGVYPEDFSIYDAFSYLLDDIDGDGYYQSFSIVFDADYHPIFLADASTGQANVYAYLYLSQNGGPWQLFHSTDIFSIYSDTADDEFEVFTTLEQGFSTDNFDVLIDLYYAGSDQLVASYSSDDNNALYALPLESVDYDQPYVTEVIHTEGGSSSLVWLLLSTFILVFRWIYIAHSK